MAVILNDDFDTQTDTPPGVIVGLDAARAREREFPEGHRTCKTGEHYWYLRRPVAGQRCVCGALRIQECALSLVNWLRIVPEESREGWTCYAGECVA